MKKLLNILLAGWLTTMLASCFSVMKADRLVYAGSLGKKIDAVLVDSISHYEFNKSE